MTVSPSKSADPGSQPMIAMRGVQKHFGSLHVLKDIDLTVGRGEVVVVIAPRR